MQIIVLGEHGFFYLNGKFVASLDTSVLIQKGISITITICGASVGSLDCILTNLKVLRAGILNIDHTFGEITGTVMEKEKQYILL